MNALTITVSSPPQPQPDHDQAREAFAHESSLHGTFTARAADVDRLIDAKMQFVMESARLRALAESSPELCESCLPLIQTLEESIHRLQEQIDRELKGLLYSLQKAPAPSPFLDDLPG